MEQMKTPAEIQYGWIRNLRYLPDYGRYEAAVVLHLMEKGQAPRDVEMITSVAAHQDEDPAALQQRLVFDAARLMRLAEAGLASDIDMPLAA